MSGINALQAANVMGVSFKQGIESQTKVQSNALAAEIPNDTIELSSGAKKAYPPKISTTQLMFGRLTDEQIKAINESGQLPENAKFVMNGMGGYAITNNFFNLRAGTRQLPEGFEVKKDVMGFVTVLPKGMDGALIKK